METQVQNAAYAHAAAVGFQAVIRKTHELAASARTLGELTGILLSLGGFQDPRSTLPSLSVVQRELLTRFSGLPLLAAPPQGLNWWCIGLWSHGRIHVSRTASSDTRCESLAYIELPEADAAWIDAIAAVDSSRQQIHMREVDATYRRLGASHLLESARFMLDHIEPSILYVGDEVFSNFGPINNLLPRDGIDQPGYLLCDLRGRPLVDWSPTERILVFCLYIVRRTGFRCEEFSGRQLTLVTLDEWLSELAQRFLAAVASTHAGAEFMERADEIYAAKQAARKTHFFYRIVNGINFNKREALGKRSDICLGIHRLPADFTRYVAQNLGPRAERYLAIDAYAKAAIDALVSHAGARGFDTALEGLLSALVRSATDELTSDIGMTRGPRDLRGWALALSERRYRDICDWPSFEYFTAVYPGSEFEKQFGAKHAQLNAILYAIAGRMTYNSWHYAPGQCPVDEVPTDRHFFFPPRMSDIGVVSNQHHGGHVLANINLSIRSPAGILINGIKHYGLVDLRFVRASGRPYDYRDLVRARELTACARAFYQALLNRAIDDDVSYRVESYTKEWYAQAYAPARAAPAQPEPLGQAA